LVGDTVNDGERSSWNGQRAAYSLPCFFSGTRAPTISTMSDRASSSSMKASGMRAMADKHAMPPVPTDPRLVVGGASAPTGHSDAGDLADRS
jgi:hypothetical protein